MHRDNKAIMVYTIALWREVYLQPVHDVMIDRQPALKHVAEILLDLCEPAFECSEPTSHVADFRGKIADCAVLDIPKQVLHT